MGDCGKDKMTLYLAYMATWITPTTREVVLRLPQCHLWGEVAARGEKDNIAICRGTNIPVACRCNQMWINR